MRWLISICCVLLVVVFAGAQTKPLTTQTTTTSTTELPPDVQNKKPLLLIGSEDFPWRRTLVSPCPDWSSLEPYTKFPLKRRYDIDWLPPRSEDASDDSFSYWLNHQPFNPYGIEYPKDKSGNYVLGIPRFSYQSGGTVSISGAPPGSTADSYHAATEAAYKIAADALFDILAKSHRFSKAALASLVKRETEKTWQQKFGLRIAELRKLHP